MSIDLTKDPYDVFASKIASANLNIATLAKEDINVRRITSLILDNWPMAVAYNDKNADVNNAPTILPERLWARQAGVFIARKLVTFPGGEVNFKSKSDNQTLLYIDGKLVYTGEVVWGTLDDTTITVTEGVHDVAVVCKNSDNYGTLAFSFAQDDVAFELSGVDWHMLDISSLDIHLWHDPVNTTYKSWDAPRVLASRAGWSSEEFTGSWLIPSVDQRYSTFGTRKQLTPTGSTVTFNARADNTAMYSINGSEFIKIPSNGITAEVTAGEEATFAFALINQTGPSGIQFEIANEDGSVLDNSDATWLMARVGYTRTDQEVGTWDQDLFTYSSKEINYMNYIYTDTDTTTTSAEVDLLIEPSESYGDFVEFMYNRIDTNKLFAGIDTVKDTTHHDYWPKAVVHVYDSDGSKDTDAVPNGTLIAPTSTYTTKNGVFVTKKELVFDGSEITIRIRTDDDSYMYLDGTLFGHETSWGNVSEHTYTPPAGVHTLAIVNINKSGPCWTVFEIFQGETLLDKSDTTWPCLEITDEYDVKIARNPFRPTDIELEYDLSELSMLTDSVSNSAAIYDNWYRFSHNSSKVYPAKESELEGWTYDADNDCIVSTINSSTHVGFISDDTSDNYTFNTVLSSNNRDDDNINIVIAAKKQGEYDTDEHTLTVNVNTGGVQTYVGIYQDHITTADPIMIMDPATEAINKGDGWRYKYAHVYIERAGDIVKVWVKRYDDATLSISDNDLRDVQMAQHTDDLSQLKDTDFASLNYLYAEIDLSISAPMFVGPCHYGYAQYSQSLAKYWNIERPNENPAITPALQAHLIRRYGVNLGDTGVVVSSLGNNSYQIDVDNVVYVGSFTMNPITE